MAKARKGYERIVYIGTAGTTATTQLLHVIDANVEKGVERTDETDRGTSAAVPKKHDMAVQRSRQITFTYLYYDADANVATLLAAVHACTSLAIKVVRIASGDTEFDGDCTLDYTSPGPLTGGMVMEFTCVPTRDAGREWADT